MTRPSPASTRTLYESLKVLGTEWPRDALRPETSFGRSIIDAGRRALTTLDANAAKVDDAASTNVDRREQPNYRQLDSAETQTVERAIKALQSLRNGKASQEFPVPSSILRPASNEVYYSRLGDMLKQAKQGNRIELTWRQRVNIFLGKPI